MDTITTIVLVGTARQNSLNTMTGTSVDTLVEKLPEGEVERKLLLRAGALAVYRQAGQVPISLPTVPEPAAPESLPVCTQEVATLLERMFKGEHDELLPEALEGLGHVGLRLPYELLPAALGMQKKEIRAALFPVLGERGRWLSRFNASWSWVANFLPGGENTLPADAETIWQEGTPAQRNIILRLLRAADPAKARDWLAAVWKQEKADARVELLGTFEVGLSADDEEFLEKALDDRAPSVRSVPPTLLARIPTSAFAERMRTRAATMLSYSGKKLAITPPSAIDKPWERDGIVARPPSSSIGERAWWMTQVLSLVPPTYWEERFSSAPKKLIEAVGKNEWSTAVLESWSRAALLHDSAEWIPHLWKWWCDAGNKITSHGFNGSELLDALGERVSRDLVEQRALDLKPGSPPWQAALATLPKPWSKDFADSYLSGLRKYVSSLKPGVRNYPYNDPWYQSISLAIMALPSSCFAAALERWVVVNAEEDDKTNTNTNWQIEYWRQELKKFTEVLRIRQRLIEEIVL